MPLTVAVYDEANWSSQREVWRSIHNQSDADRLFLDWDWVQLWWKHFRQPEGESLACLVVLDGDRPIGIAPMMISVVRRRPGITLRSAQCVGFRLNDGSGMLSEYLDVVAASGRDHEVRAAVLHELVHARGCQEVVFGWSRSVSQWARAVQAIPRARLVQESPQISYAADLSAGFSHYLASLGASTRRSLYNLRRRLAGRGAVRFHIAPPSELLATLDTMNALHARRWGETAFSGRRLAFHRELISTWKDLGRIVLSRLYVADVCVSVLYDIRLGGRQYNLQMGFDGSAHPGLSVGLLHLGYAMENAAEEGVTSYDFLGGRGMRRDYKIHLASNTTPMDSVRIVCGYLPILATLGMEAARSARRWLRGTSESGTA